MITRGDPLIGRRPSRWPGMRGQGHCDDIGLASPHLATYQPQDRNGFANLVNDVHAEFGFSYDPALDTDLDDPEAHYRHILLVKAGNLVVGSVALTEPTMEQQP